jgi:hypothetical protein
LLHAGVQVVDWDVTMPLEQVTQQLRRMPPARPMVFAGGTER